MKPLSRAAALAAAGLLLVGSCSERACGCFHPRSVAPGEWAGRTEWGALAAPESLRVTLAQHDRVVSGGGEAYGAAGRRVVAVTGTAEPTEPWDVELRIAGWLAAPLRFAGRPRHSPALDTLAGTLTSPSGEHPPVALVLVRQSRP